MQNNNLLKLFMFYINRNKIRQAGIYRYKFQLKKGTFLDVYNTIITTFMPKRDYSGLVDISEYLDAIFIVKTLDNVFYCTFFTLTRQQKYFNRFNVSLYGGKAVDCETFIEDNINTEKYCRDDDISFPLLNERVLSHFQDKRARYSYWNWISDIVNSDIELYLLLDGSSWAYTYEEKNIYLYRSYLLELLQLENFYYIQFKYIELLSNEQEMLSILYKNKEKSIANEKNRYIRMTENAERFLEYWNYIPKPESFIPMSLLGLFEISLRFNFDIVCTDINLEKSNKTSEYMLDLFGTKLQSLQGLEASLLFKAKEERTYKIIFIIRRDTGSNCANRIQTLLNDYNFNIDKIYGLAELQYNFKIPNTELDLLGDNHDFNSADDYRAIDIEINSLVIGLYSRNVEYLTLFTLLLGAYHSGLFYYDYLRSDPISAKTGLPWFAKEDTEFMETYHAFSFVFVR